MKSILLASASAFAFAGAAAADVSWSGSASAYYNVDPLGVDSFGTTVTLDAAATVAGDWTLSTSVSFADGGAWSKGTVSLTDGTSTLTFGSNHALGAAGIDTDNKDADVSVSTVLGGVGVAATFDVDGNTEVGMSMSAGGADIEAGFVAAGGDAGDFRLGLSTSVGGADVAFSTTNDASEAVTSWDASLGMTVSAIDLTFSMADDGLGNPTSQTWDLGASYTMGDLTLSAGIDETPGNYTVGVDYAMGAVSLGFSTDQDNAWTASVSYTEGALSVTASTNADSEMQVDGSYDIGSGVVVYAGMRTGFGAGDDETVGDEMYVGAEYDLGNGASLALSYSDNGQGRTDKKHDQAKEYRAGTTVSVSFDF